MIPKYRSTGKPAISEEADEKLIAEMRRAELERSPKFRRAKAFQGIREHRESLERSPDEKFTEAAKHFEYRFPDLVGNPVMKQRVVSEYGVRALEAARKGEVLDWNSVLPEIGEEIRRKAGLPTSHEREHKGWIDETKRSRGQE